MEERIIRRKNLNNEKKAKRIRRRSFRTECGLMVFEGDNMMGVKRTNRSAAIRILHEQGSISRKHLAECIKLTPAAITKIVGELIEENIISEGGFYSFDLIIKGGMQYVNPLSIMKSLAYEITAECSLAISPMR